MAAKAATSSAFSEAASSKHTHHTCQHAISLCHHQLRALRFYRPNSQPGWAAEGNRRAAVTVASAVSSGPLPHPIPEIQGVHVGSGDAPPADAGRQRRVKRTTKTVPERSIGKGVQKSSTSSAVKGLAAPPAPASTSSVAPTPSSATAQNAGAVEPSPSGTAEPASVAVGQPAVKRRGRPAINQQHNSPLAVSNSAPSTPSSISPQVRQPAQDTGPVTVPGSQAAPEDAAGMADAAPQTTARRGRRKKAPDALTTDSPLTTAAAQPDVTSTMPSIEGLQEHQSSSSAQGIPTRASSTAATSKQPRVSSTASDVHDAGVSLASARAGLEVRAAVERQDTSSAEKAGKHELWSQLGSVQTWSEGSEQQGTAAAAASQAPAAPAAGSQGWEEAAPSSIVRAQDRPPTPRGTGVGTGRRRSANTMAVHDDEWQLGFDFLPVELLSQQQGGTLQGAMPALLHVTASDQRTLEPRAASNTTGQDVPYQSASNAQLAGRPAPGTPLQQRRAAHSAVPATPPPQQTVNSRSTGTVDPAQPAARRPVGVVGLMQAGTATPPPAVPTSSRWMSSWASGADEGTSAGVGALGDGLTARQVPASNQGSSGQRPRNSIGRAATAAGEQLPPGTAAVPGPDSSVQPSQVLLQTPAAQHMQLARNQDVGPSARWGGYDDDLVEGGHKAERRADYGNHRTFHGPAASRQVLPVDQWWQLPPQQALQVAPAAVSQGMAQDGSLSPLRDGGASFQADGAASNTLFVKGLPAAAPEGLTRAALLAAFARCGRITQVRLPSLRLPGGQRELKGIAFLVFDTAQAKDRALQLQVAGPVAVLGRWLHLDSQPDRNPTAGPPPDNANARAVTPKGRDARRSPEQGSGTRGDRCTTPEGRDEGGAGRAVTGPQQGRYPEASQLGEEDSAEHVLSNWPSMDEGDGQEEGEEERGFEGLGRSAGAMTGTTEARSKQRQVVGQAPGASRSQKGPGRSSQANSASSGRSELYGAPQTPRGRMFPAKPTHQQSQPDQAGTASDPASPTAKREPSRQQRSRSGQSEFAPREHSDKPAEPPDVPAPQTQTAPAGLAAGRRRGRYLG